MLPVDRGGLGRLRLVSGEVVLEEVVHVQLRLGVREFTDALHVSVYAVGPILALPALNELAIVGGQSLRIAGRRPEGGCGLRVFALLPALEVDLAGGDLCGHVPLSDLADALSAVEAAAHASQVIIDDLVALGVRELLVVLIVKCLGPEVPVHFGCNSVSVFIVVERASILGVLLHASNDDARVRTHDALAGGHPVEVLRNIPGVRLLDIDHLIRTYDSLLNRRLPLLRLVLHRSLRLRNVYLFLEHVLFECPICLLCILSILRCLRSLRSCLAALCRIGPLHSYLATLRLAALLPFLCLN